MDRYDHLLPAVSELARKAGAAIMAVYAGAFEATEKGDGSPLTVADNAAEDAILPELRALTPDIPVISEEEVAAHRAPEVGGRRFWLVDPLDGTKEFINRNGEFTVNIALIDDLSPVLGVLYVPARDRLYAAAVPGMATEQAANGAARAISARHADPDGLVVVASRSHGDPEALEMFLAGRPVKESRTAGSALKFCLVAAGEADIYPRHGPTMEWDTAAGHAILLAAGGKVTTMDGAPLTYGKPDYRNPHFVAMGRE